MAPSLTGTIFSLSTSARGTDPPVKAPARSPDREEKAILARVADMLRVTVLEPFRGLRMPPATGGHQSKSINAPEWRHSCDSLLEKVAQFVTQLPLMLSSPPDFPVIPAPSAFSQAMTSRLAGRSFEAYRILSQVMKEDPSPPRELYIHQLDTLWDLGLHRTELIQSPSLDVPLDHVNLTLILLSEAESLLVGDVTEFFEMAIASSATDLVLHAPLGRQAFHQLYATIVYCDVLAVCYRYACLTDHPIYQKLSVLDEAAVGRLVEIPEKLDAGAELEHEGFLRWRCNKAIRTCVPFPSPTATSRHSIPPLGESFGGRESLVEIVRLLETRSQTFSNLTTRLHAYLDDLISRHDLCGIDELFFALQLSRNHDMRDLQKQLRAPTWGLHAVLFPRAPWALDCWLLHPFSLWIGAEYRRERAQATSWYRHYDGQPPLGTGRRVEATPQLAKLQIGLGHLGDGLSDSLRFVFAWSILHSCLLYTPAPFEDRIYRLLFLDHDQFSYSQLGLRLRQVCRYRLAGEDLYQHISLDGFSEPHRHIAGLGFLDLGRDHSEKIENLRRELTELRLLKQQLRKLEGAIDETSKRQGLQHLVGTIIVYEGDAHLQMAEQRIQLLDQAARRARSPVLPRYEASEIEEDLMHAKRAYEEVFYGYQEAQYGEITRQGGEGMIKIQEILRDWSAHSESINTAERLDTVSLLQLYQRLQEPLRSRMVQAYGTPSYRFACGGGTASASISIATGVGDLPSRLYDAGQRVLSSVGKPEEAFLWLSAGSDDMMLGAEMLMLREAGTDMSPMAIDIPMTTSTNLIPSLRNCMKRVGQTVAAVWRDSDESPDESSTLSPSAVLSTLKPEIRCAVLVQYSLNHDQTVRIHIARTDGSIVERDCHVSYEQVCATKAGFYKKVWDDEHYLLRDLDPLVSPIYDVTMPGDLAILIPGPLALYDSNAVTYVPGLRTLGQCVARARSASADASRRMRTTAVGVWERPPANMETQQKIIHTTVDGLAKAMRGNALKGSAATRKAFQDAVRDSEFLYFIGHGAGGGAEGISPPHLILHGQDKFFASDLLKTGLPGSLTILFGCSTARFRERQAKEHLNMSSACLAAGGVAVLGSMITIYTPASVGLAAKATIELAAARMNHTPGRLYNLAEAFRRGLKKARESVDVQKLNTEVKITEDQLWGAFIHVGSPLIALDDLVPVAQPNTI